MYAQKNPFMKLLLLPILSVLVSCGGGGVGSGLASVSYTGSTSKAVITQSNGENIAYTAYQNGNTGNTLGGILGVQQTENQKSSQPRLLILSHVARNSVDHLSLDQNHANFNTGATISDSASFPGSCGGNTTYTLSVDDTTYNFTGTFTFSSYCEEGATLSGSLTFSGQFNPDTLVFGQIAMSFDNLAVTAGSDSFAADGDITFNPSSDPKTMTMNMVMQDNTTSKTYKAENYVMTLTDNLSSVSMTVSGRLYDHDYGYVDLTTTTPFDLVNGDDYPSSGILVITGKNGSNGPAKARLTALSNASYQIEVDEDGDGVFEFLDTGNWTDL